MLKRHLPYVSDDELLALAKFQSALQGRDGHSVSMDKYLSFSDLALILRLIQIKHGGLPNRNKQDSVELYEHLVIDEAQDFGAVEMTVLLNAVKTRTGVTIVGDTNQKIIPEADFMGWEMLATQLGIAGASVSHLEVAHRSTKPIMDLACFLIDEKPSQGRAGELPQYLVLQDSEEKLACLIDYLQSQLSEHASAHICVVCSGKSQAKIIFELLQDSKLKQDIRHGYNRDFKFDSGITITNLKQIKGLEFDSVVLLDPSDEFYSNDDQGRKYLYTAITRAKEHLLVMGVGQVCKSLAPAINHGLLEIKQQQDHMEIEYTLEDDEPF